MSCSFEHLETPQALADSLALMRVLRPHLGDPQRYVAQLQRQMRQGYRLLGAFEQGQLVGLAGYRETENLLYGRFVYVDDLVIEPGLQRGGLGGRLLDAVRERARQGGCAHFVLDTGLHMPLAQRFYFRQGLLARGMHFSQRLQEEGAA